MDNADTMEMATSLRHPGMGLALHHASALLSALGLAGDPQSLGDHPALAWRRSGLMHVTGLPTGPGLVCPVPLTAAADGALAALRVIAPDAALPANGAMLLGERARLLDLSRQGSISANGSCRLLPTSDGHVALNLPRTDDWDMIPALFGHPADGWPDIARLAMSCQSGDLVDRGRMLGMAIAANRPQSAPPAPFTVDRLVAARRRSTARPLVIDLSSLWAGPLAGSLLGMAGARVIKVESTRRPDGARHGNAAFFALLNDGKEAVTFDFKDPVDLARLRDLIAQADIVIEASRPRALQQLGISAAAVASRGATWVSITAHGRNGPAADHIGFGDDAAIGGGLGAAMVAAWGEVLFAGDAIADPLTGVTAALAGWAGWCSGGGCVMDLAMSSVIAHACALPGANRDTVREWQSMATADTALLYPLRTAPCIRSDTKHGRLPNQPDRDHTSAGR